MCMGAFCWYNKDMILGIDEAGRGPWAGPLVVGAVVLGGAEIEGLTDSKKLTKKRRELLESQIYEQATSVGLGWVSANELDEIGMSAALRLATIRAVQQITCAYDEIIIDGTVNFLRETGKGKFVKTMPKADLLIPSVSAASIVAKVARDRYMTELGKEFPAYGFAANAGYGVAKHRAAIEEHGVMAEHRLSFAPLQKYAGVSPAQFSTPLQNYAVESSSKPLFKEGVPVRASPTPRAEQGSPVESPPQKDGLDDGEADAKTTKTIGDTAEAVVAEFLQDHGHEIISRNWRTKFCEIDIVSYKNKTVYFTEVKYRKNTHWGDGLAAITAKKQQQMRFAAELFAAKNAKLGQKDQALQVASVSGPEFTIDELFELG